MQALIEQCEKIGLTGNAAISFIKEQQAIERDLRAEEREREREEKEKEREREKEEREREREERQREREERQREIEREERQREVERQEKEKEHERILELKRQEMEMKRMELEMLRAGGTDTRANKAKVPKLPSFIDHKDDLDSYLQRFERFATTNCWNRDQWAVSLSALLSGRALDVYSRLSATDAADYDVLKEELLKRYNLTENGYRIKFREGKPEGGESPQQYIVRLQSYLQNWVELSNTNRNFDGLSELFVKEQFLNSCAKDLTVHLRERAPKDLKELATFADQFLIAHGKTLASGINSDKQDKSRTNKDKSKDSSKLQCFVCNEIGHKAVDCTSRKSSSAKSEKRCLNCNRLGHEKKDCWFANKNNAQKSAAAITRSTRKPYVDQERNDEKVACCKSVSLASDDDIEACIEDDYLLLASGKSVPIIKNACVQPIPAKETRMPVVDGLIGDTIVKTLRDTGCSTAIVKRNFVKDDQYTGDFAYMLLVDNTVKKVPLVKISVHTPYYSGDLQALCLPDAIYDLIIGNIPGARNSDDPDPSWQVVNAVTTRAQAKKEGKFTPLKVSEGTECTTITKAKLVKMQEEDESLNKFRNISDEKVRGKQVVKFEEKSGILYRVYKHPKVNQGEDLHQIVVPVKLRKQLIEVAHNSIVGGHLGIKKTSDKILSNFYWPGIHIDVTHFCRSCDVCQKTIPKGKVTKVHLGKMPLIDEPFKRVAIDLVGPIHPPSERGHRYILTLVDYATRYPEAVPLKRIITEEVAEALVNIYCRIGVPEEVLSDLGTQFVSDCTKEVTSPYPMCNGLEKNFNGLLKSMKRICSKQPRMWHKNVWLLENNIKGVSRPRSKKEVKSFLGSTGYYKSRIPNNAVRVEDWRFQIESMKQKDNVDDLNRVI